jgi:hypothetical protein
MGKLSEIIGDKSITVLEYGPSGIGKTCLWGQLAKHPEFSPIYCMDFDLRVQSLRARLSKEEMDNVYADPFRDTTVQGEAFTVANTISNDPKRMDSKYGVQFKTFICDSGTFFMRAVMARVLFLDGGKAPTTTPQLQHYMQAMSLTEEFVSKMCGSGRNFVFTCHEQTDKDEALGRIFKGVDLTGKMANRIPGYFNEMWHCEIRQTAGKEPEFVVRTKPDHLYSARTSFKTLVAIEKQEEIWKKVSSELERTRL